MTFEKQLTHPIYAYVQQAADALGYDAYVVGGVVRDLIMRRHNTDIDIVTVGSGIELATRTAALISPDLHVNVYRNFGTAQFNFEGCVIEFVGARRESYNRDSRKPIVEDGTLEDDQLRRDFTINAMAVALNGPHRFELVDPFNGVQDIADKIIRTPCDPDRTFSDDPLRMMRAIRFATQLHFYIDPDAFYSIARNAERIKIVSMERITDELNKIMMSSRPSMGFVLLDECGLLKYILPQLTLLKGVEVIHGRGHKDNFYHTMQVLDQVAEVSDNLWLRWAALLHDIAKPQTKRWEDGIGWTFHGHEFKGSKMVPKIFGQLKLPLNEKMKYVEKLVLLHLRPIVLAEDIVTDSAVRRLLFDTGDDIDDLMILCNADITSKNEEKVKQYRHNFEIVKEKLKEIEAKDHLRNWQPPIDGTSIMETFGLAEGREVGVIKNAIREAILDGVIGNNFEEAYAFMKRLGAEQGLTVVKEIEAPVIANNQGPVPSKL